MTCAVAGCGLPVVGRGWCSKHYHRWRRHGSTDLLIAWGATPAERLVIYTDRSGGPDSCWPWTGGCNDSGYGKFQVDGQTRGSHVVAWEVANGVPVPPGLFICHRCDNPPWCNPAHLFADTPAENTADMHRKGRARIRRGSAHHNSRLTPDQVSSIRHRLAQAPVPYGQLASEFGVSKTTILARRQKPQLEGSKLKTLAEITTATGFEVLEHLEAEADVPVLDGLQAQGDLFIIPAGPAGGRISPAHAKPVPAEGTAVIEATGGGHEHRLFASAPGSATFAFASPGGQDIGVLDCTETAYVLHPEHGAAGIAPGSYVLRRQREQADEERLVAD